MTLSQDHEDIVDDVRDAFLNWKYDNAPDAGMIIEHCLAASVVPSLRGCGCRADAYIFLGDGHPVIMLEVGTMKDGKWGHFFYATDDKPARVLRVGFDRVVHSLHDRQTFREQAFYGFLDGWLEGAQERR